MRFGALTEAELASMSCADVTKRYDALIRASKERSKKEHREAAERAAMAMKPFLDRCKMELALAPTAEQAREIQAISEQIYGVPGAANQFVPGSGGSPGLGLDYKKIMLVGAVGALGIFLFMKFSK